MLLTQFKLVLRQSTVILAINTEKSVQHDYLGRMSNLRMHRQSPVRYHCISQTPTPYLIGSSFVKRGLPWTQVADVVNDYAAIVDQGVSTPMSLDHF
jgi:hypothetical protein